MTFKLGAKQTVGEAPTKERAHGVVPGNIASPKATSAASVPLPSEASELAAGRPILVNARAAFTVHAGEALLWNGRELLFMGKVVGVRDGVDAPQRSVSFTETERAVVPALLAFIAEKERESSDGRPPIQRPTSQYGFSGCAWDEADAWLKEHAPALESGIIDRLLDGNWLLEPVLGRLRIGEPWTVPQQ